MTALVIVVVILVATFTMAFWMPRTCAERAPILKVYLKRAPGARPHFDIGVDASIEEFARVAPRYPVLRIVPI